MNFFKDKNILITGGTGSFGQKCVDTLLREANARRIVIFSRDELKQEIMRRKYDDPCLRFFLGDVRDKDRLMRAFRGLDIVIHTAALKQVPAAEYNPFEAVKTNVLGAQNIIDAAVDRGVEKVIALSTDKAVNPINLYGATKLCSDKLFVAGNSYTNRTAQSEYGQTILSVVRYGNVLGSRGSVVPYFQEQKKLGVLPITDKRMTRFWITLEDGVKFVLRCLEMMRGGEIFIPKLPSMNIMDLADAIAPGCRHNFVGIRPGEKLHEILIPRDEARQTLEFDDYYTIQPNFPWWGSRKEDVGKPVSENFEYTSDKNPVRLSAKALGLSIES